MEGDPVPEEVSLFPATVGDKLRGARESQGIELSEIAARTRIPQRHLEAIERSNYSSLPSITYAMGFAKSYARAIGADEVAIGRELRSELGTNFERVAPTPAYEMNDPTRTAPRGLVWIGLLVAVLILAGVGVWYGTDWFRGSAPPPEALEIPEETPSPAASPTPLAGGQVSLVALDKVWLRVSDATGKQLFEKEMAAGERYDVPPEALHPIAKTAGPEKIQVVVNGSNVPALGPSGRQVETEVSAAALLARGTPGASPTPISTPPSAPVTRPAPAPRRPRPTPTPVATPSAAAPGNTTATP
jgi:cytoskeletal protein RodZ